MSTPPVLIRSKTRIPAIAHGAIGRERVVATLTEAALGRQILNVVAPAGSGKTTAVVQFVAARPGPSAWLTLGDADGSPGRFVTYLAAAVAALSPETGARTHELLAGGISPADCAAILAEGLPGDSTLVIDDLHHIDDRPQVLNALRAFVEAIPPGALAVLVSRRLTRLNLSRSMLTGRADAVSAAELAFTVDEIADLLATRGVVAEPGEVAASSGGWAAGIVFEAIRGPRTGPGGPPPDDPFFAYMGSEVLDALPGNLRRQVVRSSLLETVDAEGLAALLDIESGEVLYGEIVRHQLPATQEPEGLRYHPRFREFLLSQLRGQQPEEMRRLLARHARRLWADGHVEDAADHLLAAGRNEEAKAAIEAAASGVLLRGDWSKVLGWCSSLGEEAIARRPSMRTVQLGAMLTARQSEEMTALVDRMRATGEFDRLVAVAPDAAVTAVFALHVAGRWGTLVDLLPPAGASPGSRAMRYVLRVGSGRRAPEEWRIAAGDHRAPLAELLQCGLYFQGRLDEVDRITDLDAGTAFADRPVVSVYAASSLRKRGRLGDARAYFAAATVQARASGFSDFWRHFEGELVFAEGDRSRGLQLVREARLMARERGHQVADRAIFSVSEGKMLVRLGLTDEAVDLLTDARQWSDTHGLPAFREWADTWLAAALLARDRDEHAASSDLLMAAIAGMERAERILEMPAAYVLLAEASWRAGDEAAHDAAVDAALRTSERMGTLAPLLNALDDVPDVLTRRIDAEGARDGAWKALARAPRAAVAPTSPAHSTLLIGTLGREVLEVDGVDLEVSPPKAVELAAAIARAGAAGASRAALIDTALGGSADGSNYLRQMVHRLRRALPEAVTLVSDGGRLWWSPADGVLAEDQLLEALVARARLGFGRERVEAFAAALELAATGPLLPSSDADHTRVRRAQLATLVNDARREYADALLSEGRAEAAVTAARAAVAAEPYREDGWLLVMRAEAAASGPAAVTAALGECAGTLARIDLEPSRETVTLAHRLRNPEVTPPR